MKTIFLHRKHYHVCSGLKFLYGALAGLDAMNKAYTFAQKYSHNKRETV